MPTTITFNDGAARTLSNGRPAPADRFSGWAPRSRPIGPRSHAMADGALHAFVFRWDYGATFELRGIPAAQMATMERLVRHLATGGTIVVNTGDIASRSYTVGLAPGAEPPDPALSDARQLTYTMSFAVINRAASPGPMLCIYKG